MRTEQIQKFSALLILLFLLITNHTCFAGLDAGNKAPDFKLPSLADDKEISLSDFKGKIVLLHMWKCT